MRSSTCRSRASPTSTRPPGARSARSAAWGGEWLAGGGRWRAGGRGGGEEPAGRERGGGGRGRPQRERRALRGRFVVERGQRAGREPAVVARDAPAHERRDDRAGAVEE